MNELYNILMKDDVVGSINNNLDILLNIIPEIKDMIGFPHNHPHHHLDVWNHTLLALEYSPKDFEIRLVLLLHDIGKPHSYQDEEIRHFKGHPIKSELISYNILKRLNVDDKEIEKLCYLIRNHDNKITILDIENNKELESYRFIIQCCDVFSHKANILYKKIPYLLEVKDKLNDKKINSLVRKMI